MRIYEYYGRESPWIFYERLKLPIGTFGENDQRQLSAFLSTKDETMCGLYNEEFVCTVIQYGKISENRDDDRA